MRQRHYPTKLARSVESREKRGVAAGFTPTVMTAMRTGIRFDQRDGKKNEQKRQKVSTQSQVRIV